MATKIDKEACRRAYNLVRDDSTGVNWVTFKYDGSTIIPGHNGADYEEFIRQCTVNGDLLKRNGCPCFNSHQRAACNFPPPASGLPQVM